MKRLITIFLAVFVATMVNAQTENEVTTLSDLETQRYKNFDGFLLDMGSMLDMPAAPSEPTEPIVSASAEQSQNANSLNANSLNTNSLNS